jgi:Domain of unknown function (DUF4157)
MHFTYAKKSLANHRRALPSPAETGRSVARIAPSRFLPIVQAKLRIGAPNDKYEQEADRVADQVLRMVEPKPAMQLRPGSVQGSGDVQPECPACGGPGELCRECEEELQPKPHEEDERFRVGAQAGQGAKVPPALEAGILSMRSGSPLTASERAFLEPRFGMDFSGMRVHTGPDAGKIAQSLNARAFTVGSEIVFGQAEYNSGSSAGLHLLAHELTHVAQQREHIGPVGVLQRTPAEPIRVTLMEVSISKADLSMLTHGISLPFSPPRIKFGEDGPIAEADRTIVQLAFNLAYRAASSSSFATKFGEFKGIVEKNLPEISGVSQQKYLEAMNKMVVHLADTTKNPLVAKSVQKESTVAGFTPIGGNDVYIRAFAIQEGRDALASLLLHESFHVAGVPAKPIDEFLEWIMEVGIHEVEASVGLPLSQIALNIASIESVEAQGQGIAFTVTVTKPDQVDADRIRIEILDGNRNLVFWQERPRAAFTERFTWNGLDASGKPTESGMHSLRVTAGHALYAARDYVLRRPEG